MTNIEWTDVTWNPVRGCRRVSPGCVNCYAEKVAARFAGEGMPYAGTITGGRWNGAIRLVLDALDKPLRWRTPRRVFVNSMSDLFYPGLSDAERDRIFAVMALAERHQFQVLTKRPVEMLRYLTDPTIRNGLETRLQIATGKDVSLRWPLPNVWLGVSAEDQQRADERIPLLLQTPAAVRFVSAEPLLELVDLRHLQPSDPPVEIDALAGTHGVLRPHGGKNARLDWVIVGGESGPGARACEVTWIRSIVEQCRNAAVPVFVKQLGAAAFDLPAGSGGDDGVTQRIDLRDRKGGDPAEWPEDLRVREWPS